MTSQRDSWNKNISAVTQYAQRQDIAKMPTKHIERFRGEDIALGVWVANMRNRHRNGRVSVFQDKALREVRGWRVAMRKRGKQVSAERDKVIRKERALGVRVNVISMRNDLSRQRIYQIIKDKQHG